VSALVCNSCLNPLDVQTARAAKWGMHREWCASLPAEIGAPMKARLQRLYDFLGSGLLRVKVLPDEAFGLIHGKAGVITRTDGSQVCFIGSANESRTAWVSNYELVWLDESEEGVQWVQEEFDALWSSPQAVDLAEAVVQDVARLIHRVVIPHIDAWKQEEADPAEPIVELPIYRRENGLWAHQKSLIKLAFDAHKNGSARYLLADQVGLGKTVQLALTAKLMALYGEKPFLILVPKPLMIQWQDELWNLLEMPSARWNGRQWIDEQGVVYPEFGPQGMRKCPRRIGIMSMGLIIRGSETVDLIKDLDYECVILDEAHRARRSNLGPTHRGVATGDWNGSSVGRAQPPASGVPHQSGPSLESDAAGTAQGKDPADRPVAARGADLRYALQGFRGGPRPSASFRTPGKYTEHVRPDPRHPGRRLGRCRPAGRRGGQTGHRGRAETSPLPNALRPD